MKMYMQLTATEDGIAQFVKQPGVSLEPGDILGILTLDDPARVKHAKPFEGQLPPMGLPNVSGGKPHQLLDRHLEILNNILDGYDNSALMSATVKDLIKVLRDPELPFHVIGTILSALSGRMPAKLEEQVRSSMESAKSKPGSEFPGARIKKTIDVFLAEQVRPTEQAMERGKLLPLVEAVERFRLGLKAHECATVSALLERYEATESQFGGNIEARVLELREAHKGDLDKVAALVLSHTKAQSKGKLILALFDHIKSQGSSYVDAQMQTVLGKLASLEGRSSIPVSLKAREVLIMTQMPSLNERSVQMEQVLRTAVSSSYYGETNAAHR